MASSRASALVALLVVLLYYGIGRPFEGPTIFADEFGYLAKAATLSGYPVDYHTDFYAGYAFFLLPAFYLGSEPSMIYQGVLFTNALLWGFTFLLLCHLLARLFPEQSPRRVEMAVLFCAIYPGAVVSSGHAMATPALAFLYIASLNALLRSGWAWSLFHGVLVALLVWCHPTGLAFLAASVLTWISDGWRRGTSKEPLLAVVASLTVVTCYRWLLSPRLEKLMTPSGLVSQGHYPGSSQMFTRISTLEFWQHLPGMVLGQLGFLMVATFGLAAYALAELAPQARDGQPGQARVSLYLILAPLGLLAMGSLYLSWCSVGCKVHAVQTWFQGRYLEAALFPLLAVGLILPWNKRPAAIAAIVALLTAAVLPVAARLLGTNEGLHPDHILGFWPWAVWKDSRYLVWFGMGAGAILLVHGFGKKRALILMVPLMLWASVAQLGVHRGTLDYYNKPNAGPAIIDALWPAAAPVALDPDWNRHRSGFIRERRGFFCFYLYDRVPRRVTFEDWLAHPAGPFLTPDPVKAKSDRALVVARERRSGVYILADPRLAQAVASYRGPRVGFELARDKHLGALRKGCFEISGHELGHYSLVGQMTDGQLQNPNNRGVLFVAPGGPLSDGDYELVLEGSFLAPAGATVQVTADAHELIETRPLPQGEQPQRLTLPLSLETSVERFQVSISVEPASEVALSACSLRPVPAQGHLGNP